MKKHDPFYLGWTFAAALPDPDESQIIGRQIVDFATATKCLKWLAHHDADDLLFRADNDDCDGFIACYEPFRKRLAALEHVAQQLRGKWARANAERIQVDIELLGHHYSSAHLALFCWGRAIRFCIWAAVDPASLMAFGTDGSGRFNIADVPRKWAAVRKVLQHKSWSEWRGRLNVQLEAERDVLLEGSEKPPTAMISVNLAAMTVTLGKKTFDVKSDLALRWVKVLTDHPGEWIAGPELSTYDAALCGARTDRLRPYLPEAIAEFIESGTGKGSRFSPGATGVTRP